MQLLRGRVHRMEALIDGILQLLARGPRVDPPETGRHGRAAARGARAAGAARVTVRSRCCSEMPAVNTERVPLQQVFLNLHRQRDQARRDERSA